jgi:hypothetical protein
MDDNINKSYPTADCLSLVYLIFQIPILRPLIVRNLRPQDHKYARNTSYVIGNQGG